MDVAVSIPQWCDCCSAPTNSLSLILSSFNPTMVRLLHSEGDAVWYEFHEFQSHNGAIAAAIDLTTNCFIL